MTTPNPTTRALTVLSLGAGVQSTTLALLACEGVLPTPDAAIFADTGWEPARVYAHLDRLAVELDRAGIPLYRVSAGNLRADVLNPNKHTNLPAFIRNPDGTQGKVRRHCTDRYKLRPIREQVRLLLGAKPAAQRPCRYCEGTGVRVAPWRAKRGDHVVGECSVCDGEGVTSRVGPAPPGRWAEQWIGFSTDEIERVSDKEPAYTRARYPLLERDMSRQQCIAWLARRGWGGTPKSACMGCPFHGNKMWREMRDHHPDEWADAVDMDRRIRNGPGLIGEQFLHRSLLPLDQAPIDHVERKEWRDRQGDMFDVLAELEDGDPDGCSPYGCRSGGPADEHHVPTGDHGMPTPEPATQDSDTTGTDLLNQVHAALTRYVVMPSAAATDAVTLWIAASHAQPAWAHAPRLVVRGPERRCGKSRLLDVVEATCHNPLITVNASPAAVYRSITDDPPVLLIDEADTIFGPKAEGANEELRGLLNAGHQRGRPALRYNAASQTVDTIATFAMAALGGIGAMPDTIEDRAVVIHMRRKTSAEKVKPYRTRRDRIPLRGLADQLTEWLRADLPGLEQAEPGMPVEDRAADTWEPLIAVADHAGGDWPDRARAAAVELTAQVNEADEMSDRLRLLADCRTAFGDDTTLPTADLIARLRALPESGWNEHGPTGLTPMKLGALLRDYGIRSGNIRFTGGQFKGYQRADFVDSWDRYCPPALPVDNPADTVGEGQPSQPSQALHPRSTRDGLPPWDGSSRPTTTSPDEAEPGRWDGLSRPNEKAVPGLTCDGTAGTAGTATPLRLVQGDR